MNARTIGKKILIAVYLGIVTLVTLLGFEWVGTYFEPGQAPEYDDFSIDLKLRSAPEDVLYATSYNTADGSEVVRYAYMTGEVSPELDEDISRRTPNSLTKVLDVRQEQDKKIETLETTFFTSPQFYEEEGKWRQIEYATTTPEVFSMSGAIPHLKRRQLAWRFLPGEPAFALTGGPYYPQPNVETVSVDGYTYYDGTTSWADTRNAATATAANDSAVSLYVYGSYYQYDSCAPYGCYVDAWYVYRSPLLFDTSALPDVISISAATVEIYVNTKLNNDNDGEDTINLVSSAPASNTAVATGDYDSFGTTALATGIDITSITTSAYNTLTLNGTGRGTISVTGVTKFGLREGHDLSGNAPVNTSGIQFASADTALTAQDPTLTVTYELATFSFGQWFPF